MRISDWSSDVCSSDRYGALDLSPTVLNRPAFGYRWGAAGWIIFSFLRSIGRDGLDRLTQRMLSELTTTFASHYTRVIGLREALQPDILQAYQRKATGEKYLIDPRSEEHTSELQSLMRISYDVLCLKKKTRKIQQK